MCEAWTVRTELVPRVGASRDCLLFKPSQQWRDGSRIADVWLRAQGIWANHLTLSLIPFLTLTPLLQYSITPTLSAYPSELPFLKS
jgi:hypothetical protein